MRADLSILARVPANIDKRRPSKEFPPGQFAAADAWLDAIVHPRPAAPTLATPVTLGEWTGVWYELYVEPVAPPTTARRYKHSLRQLVSLYPTALSALRASMLQGVLGTMSERLAPATVQGAVGVWRRCLEAAVDDELIVRNPAKRLTPPKSAPRTATRHVTAAEVAALWPAIAGMRFEVAYALLLGCGLRIGEVLGLHWSNVDLKGQRAWIQHQWTDHQMRDLPKGRNPHWVPLPPRVVAALKRRRAEQPAEDVLVLQSPHPAQRRNGKPPSKTPRPWSAETVRTDLVVIVEQTGLDPFSPHAARHGLTSALLDGGASPAVVAEIAGHASAATTLKHYAHPNVEARKQADAIIDAYLGSAPETTSSTDTG